MQRTLIGVMLLLAFLAADYSNTVMGKTIVHQVDVLLHKPYDYTEKWHQVKESSVAKFVLDRQNWSDLAQFMQVKLTEKVPQKEKEDIFIDIEGQ